MQAAADALLKDNFDFVYIHVEAPDEMGHQGLVKEKIQAIENIDRYIVGPLVEQLNASGEDYRILVLPDHPTPIRVRTHTSDPIPYLLYDSTKKLGDNAGYSEAVGKENGILKEDGYKLMEYLLNN
jgi:2,3-bisphosphoglycerate-independent phosphoglycerate mutase